MNLNSVLEKSAEADGGAAVKEGFNNKNGGERSTRASRARETAIGRKIER